MNVAIVLVGTTKVSTLGKTIIYKILHGIQLQH